MSNERVIWDKLRSAGLTPAGAAGLMGNLYAESGLRPDNLQDGFERKLGMSDADYTAAVDCGAYGSFVTDGAGYGLAQWTYSSRKAALLAYAGARGRSVGDLDMQVGYLLQELQSLFPAVLGLLRTTGSVREASDCVLLQFERPANQSKENCARRAGYGQEFYDTFCARSGHDSTEEGGSGMKLLKCLLTKNECCQAGVKIKPVGVMVHSTGSNNPSLRRYVQPGPDTPGREELLARLGTNRYGNSWNQFRPGGQQVCVHAFVGKLADGSVAAVQTLPWDVRGWHSGYASRESTTNANKLGYIGFEMCEDGLTDPVYFGQVYQAAVELTAMLCRDHGLDPLGDGVIICHQDGYQRGIASNHGDVYNWFPKHHKTMDDFRADVARAMDEEEDDDMPRYRTLKDVPEHYRPTIRKLMERGALRGEEDPDPNSLEDNVLNVSEDYCRVMTTLDRLGKLDQKEGAGEH